jgi:hypothetical protein
MNDFPISIVHIRVNHLRNSIQSVEEMEQSHSQEAASNSADQDMARISWRFTIFLYILDHS